MGEKKGNGGGKVYMGDGGEMVMGKRRATLKRMGVEEGSLFDILLGWRDIAL